MTTFWATHQVGGPYETLEDSQRGLAERQLLYPSLLALMPVEFPGKTVLDYGCGPGHDVILFLQHGAGHVFYTDTSQMALDIIEERLELHGLANRASPVPLTVLPQVDHVHCAGVLHHTENPLGILKNLRRALRRGGDARVMVYDGDLSTRTQSEVPITTWWTHIEFQIMAKMAGFDAEYVGSYECSAPWRPDCFAACFSLC